MVWVNADGLRVKFGIEETIPARVTEYETKGPKRLVEIVVDAEYLPAGGSIFFDEYVIYEGAKVTNVKTVAPSEDYADGTSIAVSVVDRDGTSNAIALGSAIALADLNSAENEQEIEVDIPSQKYLRLTTVGTFTAGKSTILIEWTVPKEETDTLVWNKTGA